VMEWDEINPCVITWVQQSSVILKIDCFPLQFAPDRVACIHTVNMLQVRKRGPKCVLAQGAAGVQATESSPLKSKRKVWTKKWKMEKYTCSHVLLLK
jgi:hypothetical protein